MKLECEVIRDLLPLYAEHIASPASTALVEEHLSTCEACRAELEQMERPVPVRPEAQEDAPLKSIKIAITRRQLRAMVCAFMIALVLAAAAGFLHYTYTAYDVVDFWDAKLQAHYEQADNGETGWVLGTRAEDVYLKPLKDLWNFQPIRYRFPRIHNAIDALLKTDTDLVRETSWMRTSRSVTIHAADKSVRFSGNRGSWQVMGSNRVNWSW